MTGTVAKVRAAMAIAKAAYTKYPPSMVVVKFVISAPMMRTRAEKRETKPKHTHNQKKKESYK